MERIRASEVKVGDRIVVDTDVMAMRQDVPLPGQTWEAPEPPDIGEVLAVGRTAGGHVDLTLMRDPSLAVLPYPDQMVMVERNHPA